MRDMCGAHVLQYNGWMVKETGKTRNWRNGGMFQEKGQVEWQRSMRALCTVLWASVVLDYRTSMVRHVAALESRLGLQLRAGWRMDEGEPEIDLEAIYWTPARKATCEGALLRCSYQMLRSTAKGMEEKYKI